MIDVDKQLERITSWRGIRKLFVFLQKAWTDEYKQPLIKYLEVEKQKEISKMSKDIIEDLQIDIELFIPPPVKPKRKTVKRIERPAPEKPNIEMGKSGREFVIVVNPDLHHGKLLEEMNELIIKSIIWQCQGNLTAASEILGVCYKTLWAKRKQYEAESEGPS